jgi:hypothetical protein
LAWANLAAAYEQKKSPFDAALAWRKAIARDPDRYEYRQFLLADLMALKKYEAAGEVCREMAAQHPNEADPLIRMGLAYELLAEQETDGSKQRAALLKAQTAFQEAGQRDPRSAKVRNNLGTVYEKLGNAPQAITLYRQALTLDPAFTDARKNLERLGAPTTPVSLTPVPKPTSRTVPTPKKMPAPTAGTTGNGVITEIPARPVPPVRRPVRRRFYRRRVTPIVVKPAVTTTGVGIPKVAPKPASRTAVQPMVKPVGKLPQKPAPKPITRGTVLPATKPSVKPGVKKPAPKKPGAVPKTLPGR